MCLTSGMREPYQRWRNRVILWLFQIILIVATRAKGKKSPKQFRKAAKKALSKSCLKSVGLSTHPKSRFFSVIENYFFPFFLSIGRFFVRFLQREITINARAPFS
jgi:hypothetical protein